MDKKLLKEHIHNYILKRKENPKYYETQWEEREEHIRFYQSYTRDRILKITEEEFYEYIAKLWAMLIWGNKRYVVDKLIEDNGFETLKKELAHLLWSDQKIEKRWNLFRKSIKGMGPAMISEILSKTHPNDYIIWNRRAYMGLAYLNVEGLPRYDYQLDGKKYRELCEVQKEISKELVHAGLEDSSLLMVDYFIWDELQVEDTLTQSSKKKEKKSTTSLEKDASNFIHNDIRDKIRNIGQWLGFDANIERKVAAGSKVDAIWESTVGNMGRVIYVFEVQTKGSIDSLIVNLLKSLNNPAVQGVVAVSDKKQLETIKSHAEGVPGLRDKLRLWDYEEVLSVHEHLEYVNESINKLNLVPDGF